MALRPSLGIGRPFCDLGRAPRTIARATVAAGESSATTEADGTYDLRVPVVTYDVTATAYGFSSITVPAVTVAEASLATVDEAVAALARSTYQRGSVSTHVTSTGKEIKSLKRYVDALLGELLEVG